MKKTICALFFTLLIIFGICAQVVDYIDPENASWRMLQKAETAYDQKDFGLAFKYADTANINRKKETLWAISTLEQAMKPVSVQKVGDTIDAVLEILIERDAHDAVAIVNGVLSNLSKEYFNFSMTALIDYILMHEVYPEADFLIGKIYELEGEYELAHHFLLKAWENAQLLTIPDQKYDILYEIAYLSQLTKNTEEYEKVLLLIIAEDPNYIQDSTESGFSKSIVTAIKNGTNVDKFFLLYRNTSYASMKAFFSLAKFYSQQELYDKVLSMSAMGIVSAVTRIEQVIQTRKLEYSYISFESFYKDISNYEDIIEWGSKYGVWEGFYIFALSVYESDQSEFAEQLLTIISLYSPDEYWARAAQKSLVHIQNTKKILVK